VPTPPLHSGPSRQIIAYWLVLGYHPRMTSRTSTPGTRWRSLSDPLAADLERIAVGAVSLTTQALAQADGGSDLTFPQWRALLILGESEDGARIGQVAARVGVTLPATGRLLRRLERRGLVTLGVDETDRRATRARLTGPGRTVRSTILAHRRAALDEIVKALGDGDRRDLAAGLAAIADAMGDLS
jgi:DNA-binding MarR family transcriptional regulator